LHARRHQLNIHPPASVVLVDDYLIRIGGGAAWCTFALLMDNDFNTTMSLISEANDDYLFSTWTMPWWQRQLVSSPCIMDLVNDALISLQLRIINRRRMPPQV